MNIVVYCPDSLSRIGISLHLTDLGDYVILFAESERIVADLALQNDIGLVLLFDPENITSVVQLKDLLREKRRRLRVRILPSKRGILMEGWRDVVRDALKPPRIRNRSELRLHPRFKWKSES